MLGRDAGSRPLLEHSQESVVWPRRYSGSYWFNEGSCQQVPNSVMWLEMERSATFARRMSVLAILSCLV